MCEYRLDVNMNGSEIEKRAAFYSGNRRHSRLEDSRSRDLYTWCDEQSLSVTKPKDSSRFHTRVWRAVYKVILRPESLEDSVGGCDELSIKCDELLRVYVDL